MMYFFLSSNQHMELSFFINKCQVSIFANEIVTVKKIEFTRFVVSLHISSLFFRVLSCSNCFISKLQCRTNISYSIQGLVSSELRQDSVEHIHQPLTHHLLNSQLHCCYLNDFHSSHWSNCLYFHVTSVEAKYCH